MNKREFFEYIMEAVKNLSIFTIFDYYHISYEQSGRSYNYTECPFCGVSIKDKKANIHSRHNGFICYKCTNEPLSAISYIMNRFGLDFKSAIFDIAVTVGITSQSSVDEYYSDTTNAKAQRSEYIINTPVEEVRSIKENKLASDETLNKVFTVFRQGESIIKGFSKISDEHLNYLRGRGLSDEDIADGKYFTIPSQKLAPTISQVINKKYGISDEELENNIPGFYKDKNGNITFKYYGAIGIPIINARGLCKGIQIRLNKEIVFEKSNKKKSSLRYIWLSSDDVPEGCSGGVGPGAPVDVTYPKTHKETWSTNLFITEGKFKAQQLSKFTNSIVISVQGVGNWREISKEINDIQAITKNHINKIFIAYDADIAYKPQVHMHANNMSNALSEEYPELPIFFCAWNPKHGKGIDDLIFNKKTESIKLIKKDIYDKLNSLVIKNLEELNIKYDDLDDEVKLKIFLECIYSRA